MKCKSSGCSGTLWCVDSSNYKPTYQCVKCGKRQLGGFVYKKLSMSEGSDVVTGYNRANYIKKLIDEIRVDIEKEMVEVDGELCYTKKWINVALLCDVVSKEL